MNKIGLTDKQYNGLLIDYYCTLERLLELAVKENASETVKSIKSEMETTKIKLMPKVVL